MLLRRKGGDFYAGTIPGADGSPVPFWSVLPKRLSHREARGNCFIPFHFREAAANLLTIDEIDPFGKIPEFKFCAVRIEPATGSELAGSASEAVPETQVR